ncbi:4Fe-4S dicluster domain-containing protein [Desulfobacterales bacterium HSG17]|nr:4Fe-4S dicluster domain-containing protein [Desulfobacterales bacterium HSG17]
MTEIYKKLATHLDNLPAGFPPTETGVELRILKRLFNEQEAKIAAKMTMMPETAKAAALRTGLDENELAQQLEIMSKKGLLFRSSKAGEQLFSAAQFVIGIWEYHLNDLDEGLIKDVNEYLPQLMEKSWLKQKTKQLRVIPVSESISAEITVMPYDVAEDIIKKQSKIVVAPCICRREHDIVGDSCDKPKEVCLAFGSGAYYYEENGLGRSISQEDALEVLKIGIEAGLVLQPGNSQKPFNICMCCGCCCQVLKNLKTLDSPAKAIDSNHYAKVEPELCTACEACVDRCHMEAISVDDTAQIASAQIAIERCIGCGVCITECPTDALTLCQKEKTEQYIPPKNVFETYMNMAQERGLI